MYTQLIQSPVKCTQAIKTVSRSGLLLLLLVCAVSVQAMPPYRVTVKNNSGLNRIEELVILKRAFLQKKIKELSTKNFVLIKHHGQPLVVQYDDLNNDGIWDEAVFLYTFKPFETVNFAVVVSDKPAAIKAVVKAHVRHKHKLNDNSFGENVITDTMPYNNQPTDFTRQKLPPYLTEGPAWENDKVGFRKYFDVRNANDLWGKTTDKMVMDFVGANPDSVYHHLSWWGMDILKVGRSLGAGAIALRIPLKDRKKDTLLRLGNNTRKIIYHSLADGPVRAMFTITYSDCNVAAGIEPVTVVEKISIWGGQYFYKNEVEIKNAPNGAELVTGIPDFYNCSVDVVQKKSFALLYSFGRQSEHNDTLTLAVMAPSKNFIKVNKAQEEYSDISNAYLFHQSMESGIPVTYSFFSLWQLTDKHFTDKQKVRIFLEQQADLMQSPLSIK
ncbi:MAG: DUF4861 family protein [Sphingobacteriia bacterium]|nr:DUF4861 family protein [Sphingobacteriia bacterium]